MSETLPTRICVRDAAFKNDPTAIYCGRATPRAKDPRCRVESPWRNPFVVRTGAERHTDPIHRYHVDAAVLMVGYMQPPVHDAVNPPPMTIRVNSLETAINAYSWLLDRYVRGEAVGSIVTRKSLTALRGLAGRPLACWCRNGEPCHVDRIIDAFRFWVLRVPFEKTTMPLWYTWGSRVPSGRPGSAPQRAESEWQWQ